MQVGGKVFTAETAQKFYDEVIRLQQENYRLSQLVVKRRRGLNFLTDDDKCNFYTGVAKVSRLTKLYNLVKRSLDEPFCNMSKDEMFVMTLSKLRLNHSFTSFAYDYEVSVPTISKYFHRTLYILYECCKWALRATDKDIAAEHNPIEFKVKFGRKRVFIIDCFEVRCQTPGDLKAAAAHYSQYKRHETIKYLIAIHPDGTVAFISDGFSGRTSDREIFIQSRFADNLEEDDVVLADKGFDVADLVETKNATLNIPTFLRQKRQFTVKEHDTDKQITALRIHVERYIGLIRNKYTILSDTIDIVSIARFQNGLNIVDLIVKVSCMNKPIVN